MVVLFGIFVVLCLMGEWTEIRNKQKANAYLANKYDKEVKGK